MLRATQLARDVVRLRRTQILRDTDVILLDVDTVYGFCLGNFPHSLNTGLIITVVEYFPLQLRCVKFICVAGYARELCKKLHLTVYYPSLIRSEDDNFSTKSRE